MPADTPYATSYEEDAGPGGEFTIAMPAMLRDTCFRAPVIAWGNGSGTTPVVYREGLEYFAAAGFIVVAANTPRAGSGEEILAGAAWLAGAGEDPDSPWYGRIAADRMGASGHSLGGGGAIRAGMDPLIRTVAALEPWNPPRNLQDLQGPVLFMSGDLDTVVRASRVRDLYRRAVNAGIPGAWANDLDAGHEDLRDQFAVALLWFRATLQEDPDAAAAFPSKTCLLCLDPGWEVETALVD